MCDALHSYVRKVCILYGMAIVGIVILVLGVVVLGGLFALDWVDFLAWFRKGGDDDG
jgi:hypothetical protein